LDQGYHHDITVPEIAEYVLLWELVAEAGFNNQDKQEDEILWTRTPDSSYSAKSAYEMQFDDSIGSPFPLNVWKVCSFEVQVFYMAASPKQSLDCRQIAAAWMAKPIFLHLLP
jgi:hypothetical protein